MRSAEAVKPDYSEWLQNPENFSNEVKAWHSAGFHYTYAAHIALLRSRFKISNILELGCGIGLVPKELPKEIKYCGVDRNLQSIVLAESTNSSSRQFIVLDIRELSHLRIDFVDLVCCFAVLKHFSLEEWDSVFSSVLTLANLGLFTMQIADKDIDDGVHFHHSWVTRGRLFSVLEKHGYSMLYNSVIWKGQPWEDRFGEEWIFAVHKS